MPLLLDGKTLSQLIQSEIKSKIEALPTKPGLAFILAGNNPASEIYVSRKQDACSAVGIRSTVIRLDESISQDQLHSHIDLLNTDKSIHAILVQLPLPCHLNSHLAINRISPEKDVDGFHPQNLGKLAIGDPSARVACTPLGIHTLLQHYSIPTEGKHVAILGRSLIVGKPLALLLSQKNSAANATVSLINSYTADPKPLLKNADIIVCAMGKREYLKADMIKEQAVIIDVGINRDPETKKLFGDVDYQSVQDKAYAITPVPGGVGPMTIAMVLQNTLKCADL